MAETSLSSVVPVWRPAHPLTAAASATVPVGDGERGVTLCVAIPSRVSLLVARHDAVEEANAAIAAAFGIAAPGRNELARGAGAVLVRIGLGQWLHVLDAEPDEPITPPERSLVTLTDQTGGRVFVRVAGPRAADVLARSAPVDLHPRAFGPDAVATTTIAHVGATLWRQDAGFVVSSPRSTALDLWHHFVASAGQFGLALSPAPARQGLSDHG